MRKIILNHHKIVYENKQDFYNSFGVSLEEFFDPITGFDIIKFDKKFIKTVSNESIKDKVFRKFGREGVDIITNLL